MAKLDELFLEDEVEKVELVKNTKRRIKDILLSDIKFNDKNLYNKFDTDSEIINFAEAIKSEGGIRIPISVYRDNDKYVLLGGERRTRAYLYLQKYYGYSNTIPAIIENITGVDDEENIDLIMLLNKQRTISKELLIPIIIRNIKRYEDLISKGEKLSLEKSVWIATQSSAPQHFTKKVMQLHKDGNTEEEIINIIMNSTIVKKENNNKKDSNNSLNEEEQIFIEDLKNCIERKLSTKVSFAKNKFSISFNNIEDLNRILELLTIGDIVNE